VRYWDLAATQDGGDWTVGVLMSKTSEGTFTVDDVQRIQGSPAQVEALVRQTAELDGSSVKVFIEEEPGSAGKGQTARYAKLLVGFTFKGIRSTGDKSLRADPVAAQAEAGNVQVVSGPWLTAYLTEMSEFGPGCAHDDQVDATSGAFEQLTKYSSERQSLPTRTHARR
jgi:predicted phage terminase large subunit-like protein